MTFSVGGKQEKLEAEKILIAVGRAPRTGECRAGKDAASSPSAGFVHTDGWMETSEPGVYAVGDMIAGFLRPRSVHAGHGGSGAHCRQTSVAAQPATGSPIAHRTQISSVGMTQAAARQAGREVKIGKFPLR